MAPEDRKNIAEAWFAYAKIVALVVVAGWTWWQWDKTIFPKEQWDQSVRASSARVDLRLDSASFKVGKLIHDEVSATDLVEAEDEARLKNGVPTLIKFDVPLHNDRPFPVQLKVERILLRQATVPKSGASVQWNEPETLAVSDLFNVESGAAWIVETGSKVILSGQHVTAFKWCCAAAGTKQVKFVELSFDLSLQGIDPKSSQLVDAAQKDRQLKFVALITENMSAVVGNKVANNPFILNWAQRDPRLNYKPPT